LLPPHCFGYCSSAHEQYYMKIATWTILEKVCIISLLFYICPENITAFSMLFFEKYGSSTMCRLCYFHLLSEEILQSYYTVPLEKYTTIRLEIYICSTVCLFQPGRILLPYSVATPNKKKFTIHCLFRHKNNPAFATVSPKKIKLHHHVHVLINSFQWTWTSTASFIRRKYNSLLLKQIQKQKISHRPLPSLSPRKITVSLLFG
jgi:hypothetical protein